MKNIAKKIVAMQKAMRHVEKDGAIKGGGVNYRFVSIGRLSEAVNIALCEFGLAIVGVEVTTREHSKVSGMVLAHMKVTLCDPDTGETASFEGDGQGIDNGDKAASKAQTMARKALWQTAFCIAAGDDAEVSFAHRDAALAVRAACDAATSLRDVAAGWKRHATLLQTAPPELRTKAWGYVIGRWRSLGGKGDPKEIGAAIRAFTEGGSGGVVLMQTSAGLPPDDFDIPDEDDELVET